MPWRHFEPFFSVSLRCYQVCNTWRIFSLAPFDGSAHSCIRRDLCGIRTARYPTMHLTSASDGSNIGKEVILQ